MKIVSNWFIVFLFFVFIISQFVTSSTLQLIYTFITAAIILISLIYSKGLSKVFGIIMMVIGSVILIYQQADFELWETGLLKNVPLVCLILIVPILGIPIGLGNYNQHLAGFTARFHKRPDLLYLIITGLFILIGPITNLGAIYIVNSMIERLKLPKKFLAKVYVRGITSVHTWSPYFASVFLVVYSLDISIYRYLPYGLVLSLFQVMTAYFLFRWIEMKYIPFDLAHSNVRLNKRKLIELFVVLVSLTGLIFAFEPFVPINVSALIGVIVFIFAFLWCGYLQHPVEFLNEMKEYRKTIFPGKANEINLLLSAGFFGVVVAGTPISAVIQKIWGSLAGMSIFVLIFMTIMIVAILSFIGVHQIVTISTIIATVSYEALGISVITMAMTLLSAWAVSTTVSPITPVITIVNSIIKENPFKIILKWNLHYAIILALIHSLVIYVFHLLGIS